MITVAMFPRGRDFNSESGIRRVVEAYEKYLPECGVQFVDDEEAADVTVGHAGIHGRRPVDIAICHGLYWTADLPCSTWEWRANRDVTAALRAARAVTVPSEWVAETLRRDMRLNPIVLPHGIEWQEWEGKEGDYVLWNKNRTGDVCNPEAVHILAAAFPQTRFLATFAKRQLPNIRTTGTVPHDEMKGIVEGCAVYLSTTKETFGIGVLEAMAAGKPVLGWAVGGNLELVQHGVNGYLAAQGDYEDLKRGLVYCLLHKEILGRNGRELVKQYGWRRATERLVSIIQAVDEEKRTLPSVTIVIPYYNQPREQIERAIRSAVEQDFEHKTIVVVDDGSEAENAQIAQHICEAADVRYIRQHNQGVAAARNRGIAEVRSRYVCCLDADDWIEPSFLSACIVALEEDWGLGVAYTGLTAHTPDGKETLSQWPGQFDYNKQLKRKNQIPTCCVFRYEAWERAGGYRGRYCPGGAGSEDAAFWTAIGAMGFDARKVTEEGLFHYSLGTGNVTGNRGYREVDWLRWYAWAHDGRHPFASVATPKRFSHPVRQYDEPMVSIIIPCIEKHLPLLVDCLDSLEAQTFRRWEAIVVLDGASAPESLRKGYPFVRFIENTGRPRGAGWARNRGAEAARGAFLLFLDADDYLTPEHPDSLERMVNLWQQTGNAVYTDYLGRAFIEDVSGLDKRLRSRILNRNEETTETMIRYQALDFHCERAIRQPEGKPGEWYIWNLVTTLVLGEWHEKIGGFDEQMETWEDWDYFIRLARSGVCFSRLDVPAVTYRFYSGVRRDEAHRREGSRQKWVDVLNYMQRKKQEAGEMGCSCRGRKAQNPPSSSAAATTKGQSTMYGFRDEDFVLVRYIHPNQGAHQVVGTATRIKYGRRKGGGSQSFLVHKDDVAAQPHLFQPVPEKIEPPKPATAPPPPPKPLKAEEKKATPKTTRRRKTTTRRKKQPKS